MIESELCSLLKAIKFAARKHARQRRKDADQTPYINHPIAVATVLAVEAGVTDLVTLQAAVLHDTLEDTETTVEEIELEFGREVASVVVEVTDDKSLPAKQRKLAQVEHAPAMSLRAARVKAADKISNLRDLQQSPPTGWTTERRLEYVRWSAEVVSRLRVPSGDPLLGVFDAVRASCETAEAGSLSAD